MRPGLLKAALVWALASVVSPAAAEQRIVRVGVLAFDNVLTSDLTAPVEVFGAAAGKAWPIGFEVTVVAADGDLDIVTEEGLKLRADVLVSEAGDFDVIVAPSAYDMAPLLENKTLIDFLSRSRSRATWMTGNCSGAQLLAQAGLLDGRRATTWAGGEFAFQARFPRVNVVFDRNVVVDDGVITSNGGAVSYEAALRLLAHYVGDARAAEIAGDLQIARLANAKLPARRDLAFTAIAALAAAVLGFVIGVLLLRWRRRPGPSR